MFSNVFPIFDIYKQTLLKFYFKILTLILFLLLANRIAKAGNCIPYGTTVTLTRQSEVDSFPINYPGCDVVEGELIITGGDINNLNGLNMISKAYSIQISNSFLTSLIGLSMLDTVYNLRIDYNSLLTSLNGLNTLSYVGDFYIRSNPMLINMTGLSNLKKVATDFHIQDNQNLSDFTGLTKLNEVFTLDIYSNPTIVNLNGLQGITKLDNFTVSGNSSLLNLLGLDNITSAHQHCTIEGNPLLTSLNGLNNLQEITSGTLSIANNAMLTNFEGLDKLRSIGGLNIQGNINLIDFEGIESLLICPSLSILDNLKLDNLFGLNTTINPYEYVYILRNPKLNCCIILKEILNNHPSLAITTIGNNDIGCNSESEIRALTPTSSCCITAYANDTIIICQGSTYIVGSHNYTSSGVYNDTIHLGAGCDSIITTNLTVHPKSYQIQNKNLCIGQFFTLSNGRVITTNGIYKDTIPTICDSIIEYRLSFLNNITVNQNVSACRGKTYTLPKGAIVNISGIYRDTLRASFGCDSIIVTNLAVINPTPFTNNVTICRGKTFARPNGNIVSTTGLYYDTIKAPNICDSIVITNLTVAPYLQSSQTVSTCLGKSFVLPGGRSVNQSGTYRDTISNSNGCDSIITTNLTITNPIPFTKLVSICEGQTYMLPNGNKISSSGTYTDTIRKPNTCDSIVITNLNVFPNNFTVSLNAIDTIESGSTITLLPVYTGGIAANWNWTPAINLSCSTCENPVASPAQTTLYVVSVKASDGCEDTAQTKIFVRQTNIYVPQAFSPNNDGVNDFAVVFANNPKSFSMKIYNRWGELVFESNDVNNPWNGTYKGADCPQDNYTYILDVTMQNGKSYHKQSSILLLR